MAYYIIMYVECIGMYFSVLVFLLPSILLLSSLPIRQ